MQRLNNTLAGSYLERRVEARERADWLDIARADRDTVYVVNCGTTHFVRAIAPASIAFIHGEHEWVRAASAEQFSLLGWFGGKRCVSLNLEHKPELSGADTTFAELRSCVDHLHADEAGLLAYARALAVWRARTRYCGVCGTPTQAQRAGHVLQCRNPECYTDFFPRIDPAIIVLVTDGERALLGRQAGWPAGRYSTLAGFVEPGESLEDAARREVLEETAVSIENLHYHSSQPWPFPCSLMLGFIATANASSVVRVNDELEHAAWFTAEQIRHEIVPPTSYSISHRLIQDWLQSLEKDSSC